MIRLSFIVVAVAVIMVATTSLAMADGGPHGNYTATTDACAACHRAHTGVQAFLLNASGTMTDFCDSCHGTGALGANTDVQDGVYQSNRQSPYNTSSVPGGALNGGGFSFASVRRDWTGTTWTAPYSGTVTSKHNLDDPTQKVWGSGANDSSLTTMQLQCTSCHDPHGTNTYRLTTTINNTSVPWTDEGSPTKSYTTLPWNQNSSVTSNFSISAWCTACHTRYYATVAGSGSTTAYTIDNKYRHRIDMPGNPSNTATFILPLGGSVDQKVNCLTCHVPHGTNATVTGYASSKYSRPDNSTTGLDPGGQPSVLLRLDNRGVCENCHRKDPSGW